MSKGQTGDAAQTRAALDSISQAAREATARMSELVWATNPRHDSLDNLVAFLRQHAAGRLESVGIDARLVFPSDVPAQRVSATFRRNLLLTLKEALTNAIKHAASSSVTLRLDVTATELLLRVEDNERGFESPAPRTGGQRALEYGTARTELGW